MSVRALFSWRRVALWLVVSVGLWALLTWLTYGISLPAMFAVVGLVLVGHGLVTGSARSWESPWWGTQEVGGEPDRIDGRIRYLRRQIDQALDRQDAHNRQLGQARIQAILRDAARFRLEERRPGPEPSDAQLRDQLAEHAPELTGYLFAEEPPPVTLAALRTMIDRIEAL